VEPFSRSVPFSRLSLFLPKTVTAAGTFQQLLRACVCVCDPNRSVPLRSVTAAVAYRYRCPPQDNRNSFVLHSLVPPIASQVHAKVSNCTVSSSSSFRRGKFNNVRSATHMQFPVSATADCACVCWCSVCACCNLSQVCAVCARERGRCQIVRCKFSAFP